MRGDDRSRVQVQSLDLAKVNDALRKLSDQIARLEGRSGPVNLRDSISVKSEKQTLIDFDTTDSGKASIVAFGTENATIAFAKGARKDDNGDWIALDTVSTIWALTRSGDGILYVDSDLVVGQSFIPTVAFTVGTGGSVSSHTLVGGTSPHTASGLTTGHAVVATGPTSFGFGQVDHGNLAGLSDDDHPQYVLNTGDTITGNTTITSGDSNPSTLLLVENTNADSEASGIQLRKTSASPAAGDNLGHIRFAGYNSTPAILSYIRMTGKSTDLTAGAEYSELEIAIRKNGAITSQGIIITGGTPSTTAGAWLYATPIAFKNRADTLSAITLSGALANAYIYDTAVVDTSDGKIALTTLASVSNAGIALSEAGTYRISVTNGRELANNTGSSVYCVRCNSSGTVQEYLWLHTDTNVTGSTRVFSASGSCVFTASAGDIIAVTTDATSLTGAGDNWNSISIERLN